MPCHRAAFLDLYQSLSMTTGPLFAGRHQIERRGIQDASAEMKRITGTTVPGADQGRCRKTRKPFALVH